MAVSKVVYGNQTLIDLTGDTVAADNLIQGVTAHGANGLRITGTVVIPTRTSELTNDSGFVTSSDLDGFLPLPGGTMTGPIRFQNGSAIRESEDLLRILATSDSDSAGGARLHLYQRSRGGYFSLGAVSDSGSKSLVGKDSGSLQWDGVEISQMSMPESSFSALTLPANGGTVTAPHDGYLSLVITSTASGQYVRLDNNGNYQSCFSSAANQNLAVTLPVAKGSVVTVRYTASGSTKWLRFKRAVGARWEA